MYETIHKLLCISNDVFVTYQIQGGGGLTPNPPLRTPLFESKTNQLIHQFGVVRAVSWSSQNAESHWSHVLSTLIVETSVFTHFIRGVVYSAI